jgi:hypothetical protein
MSVLVVTEKTHWTILVTVAADRAKALLLFPINADSRQAIAAAVAVLSHRQLAGSIDLKVARVAVPLLVTASTIGRKSREKKQDRLHPSGDSTPDVIFRSETCG